MEWEGVSVNDVLLFQVSDYERVHRTRPMLAMVLQPPECSSTGKKANKVLHRNLIRRLRVVMPSECLTVVK